MLANVSFRQFVTTLGMVILILLLLLTLVDVDAIFDMLRYADWRLLLLAIACLLLSYGIFTLRTRYLLSNKAGFLETLHVDNSGFMLSILMQIPNSVYRAIALNRTTPVEMSRASSAVVVEFSQGTILRLIGLVLVVVLLAGDIQGNEEPLLVGVGIVGLLLAILFAAVSYGEQIEPRLTEGLAYVPLVDKRRASGISSAVIGGLRNAGSPGRFAIALLLSLGYWAFGLGFYYFTLRAFELDVPMLIVALTALIIAPPFSPMMPGIFHGLLIAPLIGLQLLESAQATAYAVLLHAIQMIILIVLGAWGIASMDIKVSDMLAEIRKRRDDNRSQS
jgi:uncharacterized membrane protein YbhN (UPF0104 family)